MSEHPLSRILVAVLRPLVKVIFPYRVKGLENLPQAGKNTRLMLCCNHISNIDPVYLLMGQN